MSPTDLNSLEDGGKVDVIRGKGSEFRYWVWQLSTPVGKQVADWAMQVMGGAGYCREFPVERLWRDAKLLEIGGGTIEAHQKNISKDLAKQWQSR